MPDGTVTFLLTDIERSTALWGERPDDMAAAVARHYEILDDVIAANGGIRPVEQGEGDSIVAVFSSARDAVVAAAGAQRWFTDELPWLKVRIALHTGEALLRDEDNYAGPSIIRCARLRACGHGGQVLVSDTTADVVGDTLPEGMALRDLGVVRLRDLVRPEQVWQLEAPGLELSFPPLRALDAPPHNLPAALSSLIGRHRELREVADLLGSHRLVTLSGAGGVGKTRLAQQVATDLLAGHTGGSWWVELASVTSGGQVTERVAAAIGMGSSVPGDVTAGLCRQLRSAGPTLIVLDNAEHVVGAVATLSQTLLEGCPDLRVLVTSREPLGVPGETVWRVPSLATAPQDASAQGEDLLAFDAARLFVERALEARPNLVLDTAAATAVSSICARLDGIPLAIELAAARARNMPLDRLSRGLDDAFRLLTGGARTALERQQTLLGSIAWSVDLLDDRDDVVFRQLAVFAGWFSLDAAEVVAADGEHLEAVDVLDALGRLVDKSLVQFDDDSGRYRLLETVRQFALERLRQRGELPTARTRHATWCATWADDVAMLRHGLDAKPLMAMVPDVVIALDWATADAPDLALRVCAGLGRYLTILAPSTCHRLFDWILDLDPDAVDPPEWARAVGGLVTNAFFLDRTDVMPLVPLALKSADPDDRRLDAYLRSVEHFAPLLIGDVSGMRDACAESIANGDDLNTKWFAAAVAFFAAVTGDLPTARHHLGLLDDVLGRWGLTSTPDTAGFGFPAAIEVALLEGRLGDAHRSATAATLGPTEHSFPAAGSAARLACLLGDEDLLEATNRWVERHEPPHRMRGTPHGIHSEMALHHGDTASAAASATTCWEGLAGNGVISAMHAEATIVALLADGRVDDARRVLTDLRADAERSESCHRQLALTHFGTALIDLHEGHDQTAAEAAHALLEVAHRCGFILMTTDALLILAELAARRNSQVSAARLAGAASSARRRIGYRIPLVVHLIAVDPLAKRLSDEHAEAFEEGGHLDLDGAVAFARRMRGERNRPAFGWASLTPTERQVADLAAEGATNAQIAQRLLIRPATVKTHLTHVFAKLGVANRTELAHRSAHTGTDETQNQEPA